jgi:hypothetical protein
MESGYASKVMDATSVDLRPENLLGVPVVSDNRTGRFRLQGIMAVYVEMKTRQT